LAGSDQFPAWANAPKHVAQISKSAVSQRLQPAGLANHISASQLFSVSAFDSPISAFCFRNFCFSRWAEQVKRETGVGFSDYS